MLGLLAVTLTMASGATPEAESFKVYRGMDGQTVEVVGLAPRADQKALVRVSGANSDADGLALPCTVRPAGSGFDYLTRYQGGEYVVLAQRDGQSSVSVPGRADFTARFSQDGTDAATAKPVLQAFAQQQASGQLAAFARKQWPYLEKKYSQKAAAAEAPLQKSCGAQVKVRLDFNTFDEKAMAELDVWALCEPLVKVAARRCEALKKTPLLTCRFGPALDFSQDPTGVTFTTTSAGASEGSSFLDRRWAH